MQPEPVQRSRNRVPVVRSGIASSTRISVSALGIRTEEFT